MCWCNWKVYLIKTTFDGLSLYWQQLSIAWEPIEDLKLQKISRFSSGKHVMISVLIWGSGLISLNCQRKHICHWYRDIAITIATNFQLENRKIFPNFFPKISSDDSIINNYSEDKLLREYHCDWSLNSTIPRKNINRPSVIPFLVKRHKRIAETTKSRNWVLLSREKNLKNHLTTTEVHYITSLSFILHQG